ncbi:V-type ATPase subunit [Patescibacteria group bacterium]|nr:V-type ATPase subunit [Patescibacteria group bacterium]MBU1702885.1 V-type ATPase subunit [Patescibacteria group bacterium]MBU1953358.1 V-type ATPase subunit [Patescibacteria group bacterium]
MSKVSTYDFAYSVGVVRALETMLLNENEVERMVLAKDAADAFRILNEFDYADNKAGIDSPSEFQHVISEGLMDIKKHLEAITPDKRVLNILWHYYDFHNMKTLVKAKVSKKTFEEVQTLLSNMGAIPVDALKAFIMEEDMRAPFGLEDEKTEEYIKAKLIKVQKLFEKEQNPQVIDLYLDQKLMRIMRETAAYSENKFLTEYMEKLTDFSNIKLFFRMKSQKKEQQLFEIACMWRGTIPHKKMISLYKDATLTEFAEAMKASKYGNLAFEGLKEYEEKKTFIHLEKLMEDHLTEFIKRAKLIPFGPEALIAYFLAKRNNALILRMIMISKLGGIEPEDVKPKLRKLYR